MCCGVGRRMIRVTHLFYCLLCFACSSIANQGTEKTFTVFTEDFPPFNYVHNDKLVGSNVELVNKIFAELDITPNYQVLPWARAYQYVTNTPNTLIFSIARNKEREELFKWVGAFTGVETCLFSLKSANVGPIQTLSQAKNYHVVTQLNGHINMVLARHGFEHGSNLTLSISVESSVKMLESGRADLIGLPKDVVYHFIKLQGRDPYQLIQEQLCFDSTALYLAFNKNTPEETVERFRQAMKKVKVRDF